MIDLSAEPSDIVLIQRPARIDAVLYLAPEVYAPDWRALLLTTLRNRSMVRIMQAEPSRWYWMLVGRYFDVQAVNDAGVWVSPQFCETPLRPIRFEDIDL